MTEVKKPPGLEVTTGPGGRDYIQDTETGEVYDMTEAAKAARRAYKKQWNAKNRDKVKAAQARYWERKAQAAQDQQTDEPTAQEAG